MMQNSTKSAAAVIGVGSTSLIAAAIGGAAPAEAQGAPKGNWTGLYIGFTGGFAAMSTQMNDTAAAAGLGYAGYQTLSGTDAKLGGNGAVGGLHLGYNQQVGQVVLGAEAAISWLNAKASGRGSLSSVSPYGYAYGTGTTSFSSKISALATIKGRLGYDINGNTMVFVSGGFASGRVKNTWSTVAEDTAGDTIIASSSKSGWANGFVLGGGIEQKLSSNLMLKAELEWVKLKSQNVGSYPATTSGYSLGVPGQIRFANPELVIGRVGLSYKF